VEEEGQFYASERELGKMREEGWWRARMTAIVAPIKISVKGLFAKKTP